MAGRFEKQRIPIPSDQQAITRREPKTLSNQKASKRAVKKPLIQIALQNQEVGHFSDEVPVTCQP